MQAKIQDRAFNEESARSQFQLNPFQWHNHGRGHPMLVVTFWLARRDNHGHEIRRLLGVLESKPTYKDIEAIMA